jgi:hypothetical protein
MGPVRVSVIAGMLMLCFAASASAISKPIAIGSNTRGLPSTPAVAVDPTGAAYIAWLNPPADTTLTFCKVPVGATKCDPVSLPDPDPSHAQYFDPPSVLVNGTIVRVFEEVDGAANNNQNGMYEWISTDGGASFSPFPYAISYTAVGDTAGAGPMPVIPLFGANVGFGYVAAGGNPVFQTNSLASPTNYSPGAFPPTSPAPPFATLGPSPNNYVVGNLGGEIVSQLSGTTGLLGVFQLIEAGPCPSNQGLVFTYAAINSATTNAALDTSPGLAGSPWSPLAGVQCNAEYPALTSGPSGLGLLFSNDASLTHTTTQFRRFTAPATFGGAVTVASGAALQPSLTQDGAGGLYATWLSNGTGLRFAYSNNAGKSWFGPVTLFSEKGGTVSLDSIASATNTSGQGWAVFASGGTEYAQPFVAADALPPMDSHLKLHSKSFSSPKGTKVTYFDTEPATTTFKVLLLRKGHKPKGIGSFHRTDHIGKNSFHWSGKVDGHDLAPGSYELEATPKLGSLKGKTISAKFGVT